MSASNEDSCPDEDSQAAVLSSASKLQKEKDFVVSIAPAPACKTGWYWKYYGTPTGVKDSAVQHYGGEDKLPEALKEIRNISDDKTWICRLCFATQTTSLKNC